MNWFRIISRAVKMHLACPMTPRDMQWKLNDWEGQIGTSLLLGYPVWVLVL